MTARFPSMLFGGSYPSLMDELARNMASRIKEDPLLERIVCVPSNYLADELYFHITAALKRPLLNLRIMTILDFARRLLKHRGIATYELDSMSRAILMGQVIDSMEDRGELPYFGRTLRGKGFVSAMLRLFDEMEEGMIGTGEADLLLGDANLPEKLDNPEKARELLSIFKKFLSRVSSRGFHTRSSMVRKAMEGFEVPGYPFHVSLFGFYDFTRLQWLLVEKVLLSGLADALYFPLPPHRDARGETTFPPFEAKDYLLTRSFRYAGNTLSMLLHHFAGNISLLGESPSPEESVLSLRNHIRAGIQADPGVREDPPFKIIRASHAQGEVRAVARLIRKKFEQEKVTKRRALIYRHLDEASVVDVEDAFREYGIPYQIIARLPLSRISPAKLLLKALRLPLRNYPRRDAIDLFCSSAFNIPSFREGMDKNTPLWDSITREAGITRGEEWERKLSRYDHVTGREGDAGRALASFYQKARGELDRIMTIDSYNDFALFSLNCLQKFILIPGEGDERGRCRRAMGKIVEVLSRFRLLDRLGITFHSPEQALDLLERVFAEEKIPLYLSGALRNHDGVFVGDIISLRGLYFDEIYLMGINESIWPRIDKGDSLLGDDDRLAINDKLRETYLPNPLRVRRENLAEEELLFTLPLIMGRDIRSISFLRSDIAGGQQAPSPFLTELLSSYRGPGIFIEGISRDTAGASLIDVPRQAIAPSSLPGTPSTREKALAALVTSKTASLASHLSPWVLANVVRTANQLHRWAEGNGLSPSPEPLQGINIPPGKVNHTFLDTFIKCPYRAYLRYAVGLIPLAEPEETFSLERLASGSILHRALQIIYQNGGVKQLNSAEDAISQAVTEYGEEHAAGLPGLLSLTSGHLVSLLDAYIRWEREVFPSLTPICLEETFGLKGERQVWVETATGNISVSGKIDRIDSLGGRIRVVDYKYSRGADLGNLEEKISAAILNQLPLYKLAAEKIIKEKGLDGNEWEGIYVLLKKNRRGEYLVSASLAEGETGIMDGWRESFALLAGSLDARTFPPMPDRSFYLGRWKRNYCEYCDFPQICRVSPHVGGKEIAGHLRKNFYESYTGLLWHKTFRKVIY